MKEEFIKTEYCYLSSKIQLLKDDRFEASYRNFLIVHLKKCKYCKDISRELDQKTSQVNDSIPMELPGAELKKKFSKDLYSIQKNIDGIDEPNNFLLSKWLDKLKYSLSELKSNIFS